MINSRSLMSLMVAVFAWSWCNSIIAQDRADKQKDVAELVTPPDLLIAPFDSKKASDSQSKWAKHLGIEAIWVNDLKMKFSLIPPGEFTMGSAESEAGRDKKEVPHTVRITRPIMLGAYEVTQAEYIAIVGENPSFFSANGKESEKVKGQNTERFPVENVSWLDAISFCNALSKQEGKKAVYTIKGKDGNQTDVDWEANGYRLPTEAEWEYACRSGSTTPFHFGKSLDGRDANVDGNYPYGTNTRGPFYNRPTGVGSYVENGFGLFDMHGNVWEWCWDCYGDYPSGSVSDPKHTNAGPLRLLRGGCWANQPQSCRSGTRNHSTVPSYRDKYTGFRVAKLAIGMAHLPIFLQSEGPDCQHKIGRKDDDGWSVRDGDQANFMSYGPYLTRVPPGSRTATFRLLIDNNSVDNDPVLDIDVFDGDVQKVIVQRVIRRNEFHKTFTYQDFILDFECQEGHKLEFRTYWRGKSYVRQDCVIIN